MDKLNQAKVLFVTNCFSPHKYATSPQIGRLASYINNKFHLKILTIHSEAKTDESLNIFTADLDIIYAKKNYIASVFAKILGNRIKEILLPDQFILNNFCLFNAAKNIVKNFHAKDVIVTFGTPMSTHLLGFKLKKQYKHLKWLAVFYDPWIDNPFVKNNIWKAYFNTKFQNLVLKYADSLIFSSEEYMSLLQTKYEPEITNKMRFVPLSFNSLQPITNNITHNKLVIRHIGNFYGHRQPNSFFAALKKLPTEYLQDLTIELIGNTDIDLYTMVADYQLTKFICIKPEVSYLESLRLMHGSDLLLLIDANLENNIFLPSKLVEYIGAQRPIFAITPNGTSKKILESMGYLNAAPTNIDDIATKFRTAINLIKSGTMPKIDNAILDQYSIQQVGNKFAELIEQ